MVSSLRSRLWLTYAMLILGVLCIVGMFLVWFLLRDPTRLTGQRLQETAATIQERHELEKFSDQQLASAVRRADRISGFRILVLGADGLLLADSRARLVAPPPPFPQLPSGWQSMPTLQFRDERNQTWLYTMRPLANGRVLVVAAPANRLSLRQVIGQDYIPSLFLGGLAALLLALLLAFWVERWIVAPLRRITTAAQAISAGQHQLIPLEGPAEVQALAQAFNEMSARVHASHQSQRDFVANVSHELKTPLTSIQGFAQAILDGAAATPEALHQAATIIHTEAGRMYRLVLDLLELARLDSGIAEFKRAPVDLAALLNTVSDMFAVQAQKAQLRLRLDLEPLPAFTGDEDRLQQVFVNLLDNALKHTPPGGEVTIKAQASSRQIEIAVSDNGPGIPPDEIPRLFERFYQVDKSRNRGGGHGVGLGLAIAREIVLAHRGTISVANNPLAGCTFTVTLPLPQPDDSTVARKRPSRKL